MLRNTCAACSLNTLIGQWFKCNPAGITELMIESTQGNLLEAHVEALVNTVNTEGIMGKGDRKSTRLNSSHVLRSRMPSSA